MDLEAKKHLLRQLACGIYVIGVRDATAAHGGRASTVSWAQQLSVEPPLVGVALEVESRTLSLVRTARAFTLCMLASDGRAVASKLGRASADVPNKDDDVPMVSSPVLGAPRVEAATGWLECRVECELATGDHVLVVGRVVEAAIVRDGAPLTLQGSGWLYGG